MTRTKYIPQSHLYNQYYVGGEIIFYRGSIIQRGYGLSGIISSLFRTILPFLTKKAIPLAKTIAVPLVKNVGKKIAKKALRSGTESLIAIATKKKTPKEALKSLVNDNKNHLKRKISDVLVGRGIKKRKVNCKTKKKRRHSKTKATDIFE